MSFFRSDTDVAALGQALTEAALGRFGPLGLTRGRFALTLLIHPEPLDGRPERDRPRGYSDNGPLAFYPCSVVKVFYLVAAQQRLEEGLLQPHEDLSRAMRDMIRVSSNMATNYVVDLVTETTGDTLLGEADMADWRHRRAWVNRFFGGLGWRELDTINVCQKLMDDDRYGREKAFVGHDGANHNRLTTEATARLFHAIMTGQMITAERSKIVRDHLRRPLDAEFIRQEPRAQINGYLGQGLPEGARLWSKAGSTGWTGDPAASFRRHDAAYIELPSRRQFTLVVFTEGEDISANEDLMPSLAEAASNLVSR